MSSLNFNFEVTV